VLPHVLLEFLKLSIRALERPNPKPYFRSFSISSSQRKLCSLVQRRLRASMRVISPRRRRGLAHEIIVVIVVVVAVKFIEVVTRCVIEIVPVVPREQELIFVPRAAHLVSNPMSSFYGQFFI